jgi:hypothetical protein
MALGPAYEPPPADAPPAEDVRQVARAAARQLVADLAEVERRTAGYTDEPLAAALVASVVGECIARLAETGIWGEANRAPSTELWLAAEHLLRRSWLLERAHEKPRGYAGDYALLARIVEGELSADPLGRAIDRFFLNQAAALVVRTRAEDVAAELAALGMARGDDSRGRGGQSPICSADSANGGQTPAVLQRSLHIVSIGSGPAYEVRFALAALPAEARRCVRVTLLDYDPEALDEAARHIGAMVAGQGTPGAHNAPDTVRENLHRLAQPSRCDVLPECDAIVCPGLFDYLNDATATDLLRLFWQRLRPGGLALVGNFAPHCPSRAYMEWFGNWYLVYRTAADLRRLAAAAGIPPSCVRIGAERLGVDLFIEVRKT